MTEYASEKALMLFSENADCQSICLTKKYWWKEASKMLWFVSEMTSSKCNFLRNYLKCGWSVIFCVEGPIPKSNTKLDELLCSYFSVIINYKTSNYHMNLRKWRLFLLVMQDLDSIGFRAGIYLDFFTEFASFWIPVERNRQKNMNIQSLNRITFSK